MSVYIPEIKEEISESANMLVEDNGKIVRVPMSNVIDDKEETDNESVGVTSWNDLTDKPFGEDEGFEYILEETHITGGEGEYVVVEGIEGGETYELIVDGEVIASAVADYNSLDFSDIDISIRDGGESCFSRYIGSVISIRKATPITVVKTLDSKYIFDATSVDLVKNNPFVVENSVYRTFLENEEFFVEYLEEHLIIDESTEQEYHLQEDKFYYCNIKCGNKVLVDDVYRCNYYRYSDEEYYYLISRKGDISIFTTVEDSGDEDYYFNTYFMHNLSGYYEDTFTITLKQVDEDYGQVYLPADRVSYGKADYEQLPDYMLLKEKGSHGSVYKLTIVNGELNIESVEY